MDFNQLFDQHQQALFNATLRPDASAPPTSSAFDLVHHYAKRIREARGRLGLPEYRWI